MFRCPYRLPVLAVLLTAGCTRPFADRLTFETFLARGPAEARTSTATRIRNGAWLPDAAYDPGGFTAEDAVDDPAERSFRWRFVPSQPPTTPRGVELPRTEEGAAEFGTSEVWPRRGEEGDPRGKTSPVDDRQETNLPVPPSDGLADDELRELLDDDGVIGWNAAILLARRLERDKGPRVEAILRRLVVERPSYDVATGAAVDATRWRLLPGATRDVSESPRIRIGASLQAAAAEAWVFWLGSTADRPVEALAPIGLLLERSDLPHHVRADLYRGAARWVRPSLLPYIDEAIGDDARERTPSELRRAAIEACLVHAGSLRDRGEAATDVDLWPRRLSEARWDPDDAVRLAYGRWVATTGHHAALEVLRDQLVDESPRVREAAVESLGLLRTDAGREELVSLGQRTDSDLQAVAVAALGHWGPAAVEAFAGNESHGVRLAVAEALSRTPSSRSAGLLLDLVSDRNPRVEQAVIAAIEEWPDALATPILVRALEEGQWLTLADAERQLARRLGRDLAYQRSASMADRRRAVAVLVERYQLPRTVTIAASLPISDAEAEEEAVPRRRRDELASFLDDLPTADERLRRVLLDRLLAVGPQEVTVLEQLLAERPTIVELARRDVLPQVSEAHEALRLLDGMDLADRREGAKRLEKLAEGAPLSPFVLNLLHESLIDESNVTVWRSVLRAVAQDTTPPAARIVRLALGVPSPELRIQACEYVAVHGRADHAPWVLPVFRDDRPEVVRAAVRAAGRCRNPLVVHGLPTDDTGAPTGLHALLLHPHTGVQRDVAVALALLGDARGLAEIDRLARSPEVDVRRTAIGAMRETARPEFVETLVHLVVTERSARVRQEAFAALDHIVPEEDRPGISDWKRAPDAAAAAWHRWRREGSER